MKPCNPTTQALIETGDFFCVDIYSITLFGGSILRYAQASFDVSDGTHLFSSAGIRINTDGAQAHWRVGLDTDEWKVQFVPRAPDPATGTFYDYIGSVPWLEAVASGALDNATVTISRASYATPPALPIAPTGAVCVGAPLVIFVGLVQDVVTSHVIADVTIRDMRCLLDRMVPTHVFQAACRHTLFDTGCTLTAATYAVTGACGAASTRNAIVPNPPLAAPSGSGTYKLGRLVLTSGDNATVQATITDWDGMTLTLVSPLPFDPVAGDSFTVYPGCDKSQSNCLLFGNSVNFGGTPYIPAAETSV